MPDLVKRLRNRNVHICGDVMTDIVERLRAMLIPELSVEAADEIERLRQEIKAIRQDDGAVIADLQARLAELYRALPTWDERYFALAQHVAQWSKDPSTKVGAVVVGRDRRKIALGYNGFPPGIKDDGRLDDREVKYQLIQHAERNVLDNAQFDLTGATLVCTLHPCAECAKSIISKGVARVICPPAPDRLPWAEQAATASKILAEAGVTVVLLPS